MGLFGSSRFSAVHAYQLIIIAKLSLNSVTDVSLSDTIYMILLSPIFVWDVVFLYIF